MDVVDRHHGPVTMNLTELAFCDAKGLAALVRMAPAGGSQHAEPVIGGSQCAARLQGVPQSVFL